ncbi:MAG TPA: transglutaminase domain-containing protein, partial [Vicinamibacterales bacterium]|nr:transglutaminase domain-containing protein [Vicinamibacterales bacterium]
MTRLLFAFVFVLSCGSAAAAALPPWAREAARATSGSTGAAAVVLQDDIEVEVSEDGKIRTTRRYAVRINNAEGRRAAALREVYIVGSAKVRELRGWVVRQDGSARELGDAHILDIAAVDNDVYNEVRVRLLNASAEIADQDVFCAEIESEARLLFAQLEWQWQERWPVRRARRMLRLPTGWQARSVTFNGPHTEPTPYKDALVWEVRDLPEIRQEASMPPLSSVSPRLAVSFSGGGPRRIGQFETWDDVSAWLQALGDAVRRPSDVVARKAQEIAAAASTPLDRIRAVARYVQRVQYVSIQTGLGRGGGYQPRPPDLVLTRNYGDCKDKAALMRAMLAAVGIEAHLVAIFAGDREYVREQ